MENLGGILEWLFLEGFGQQKCLVHTDLGDSVVIPRTTVILEKPVRLQLAL